MEVILDKISKRFATNWIFKDLTVRLPSGSVLGVKGSNGSGKTTLLKIIAGALVPTCGTATYKLGNLTIADDRLFRHVSYAAPYADIIEDFALRECIDFHIRFKPFRQGIDAANFLDLLDYPFRPDQFIRNYSSGMKQRLRLALAICTRSDLILLDEPTSTLDANGRQWFHQLLAAHKGDRSVVIASNDEEDFRQVEFEIAIEKFSPHSVT